MSKKPVLSIVCGFCYECLMSTSGKILIVDDDAEIREIVHVLLESEGFAPVDAHNGESALALFSDEIDLVILDVMMDGISGYQVCRRIREKSNVPVLFLTAKNKDSDLTLGFSVGGDDYLAKPFSYAELLARVKGLLRRYKSYCGKKAAADTVLECNGLMLHSGRNEVLKNGKELNLTEKEYQILRLMLRYRGKMFSAQNLYESIWEEPFFYSAYMTAERLKGKVNRKHNAAGMRDCKPAAFWYNL